MGYKAEIAIILLNYNDNADLKIALSKMERQDVNAVFIIVDNDSKEVNRLELEELVKERGNYYINQKKVYYSQNFPHDRKYYLVKNDCDAGFSGGNNVGFRVAYSLGIKYAFLISPDVRIDNPNYLREMLKSIRNNPMVAVEGSNIIDLDGNKQSPSRLITFKEEFFWFLSAIKKEPVKLLVNEEKLTILKDKTIHGCCMLFDVDFLKEIDYLDEGVFMYCEEPILQARIMNNGRQILYNPNVTAVHAHQRRKKANRSLRMLDFIKSRKYYIENYSSYSWFQKKMLSLSYNFCYFCHYLNYRMHADD